MSESSEQQPARKGSQSIIITRLDAWALSRWNNEQATVAVDDPFIHIRDWRQTSDELDQAKDPTELERAEPPNVAQLVRQSCDFFRDLVKLILRHDALPSEISNSIRSSYETLMLWDDAHKVSEGGLDPILARSSTARTLTSKSIRRIAEQLTNGLASLPDTDSLAHSVALLQEAGDQIARCEAREDGTDSSDDGSSASTSIPGWNDASEVSKNLAAHAECLMGLDSLYRNPPPDPKPRNTTVESISAISTGNDQAKVTFETEWRPDHVYRDRISQRFPRAQESLVARLAQANLSRYLRCKNKRDRDDAQHIAAAETAPVNIAAVPSKKWKDSGVGTSLGPDNLDRLVAKYAKTVMSYGQNNEKTSRIPPISDKAREGKPFECYVCGKQVVATNDVLWKQHLLSDLQPYICLDVSCEQSEAFGRRDSWISHLGSEHYREWASAPCPLCGERMENGMTAITDHLRYHLEELALACGPSIDDSSSQSGEHSETKNTALISCPYRKRNPRRFNIRDYRACAMQGLADITSLRVHLFEYHTLEIFCTRCKTTFPTAEKFDKHLSRNSRCTDKSSPKPEDPEDGMDNETTENIRMHLRMRNKKMDSWWKVMWRLLFPKDAAVPAPDFIPPVENFEIEVEK